jgi:DNA-directed RNA polymerase specialized sigma24 family protein
VENARARSDSQSSAWIAEPGVRDALRRYFARRAPAADVDDLVQGTLTDVLAAANAPAERNEWNRWVYGVARHKLADHFRARPREALLADGAEEEHIAAESAPHSARDLLRWAERELPEGDHAESTLEALLDEADGEAFEDVARARKLPPARLRQRVTRLRRHFRERWAAQVAWIGVVLVFGFGIWFGMQWKPGKPLDPIVVEEPRLPSPTASAEEPAPREVAQKLRQKALEDCKAGKDDECLRGLDEARALDPEGETPEIAAARARAEARKQDRKQSIEPVPTSTVRSTPPRGSSTPLVAPPKPTSTPPAPKPINVKPPKARGFTSDSIGSGSK